jgi:hypothetical protein
MTLWWLNCFSKDMASTKRGNEFRYYMHDGPHALSFELAGELSDNAARELEQAWRAASSVIGNRSLIVDLSYVTHVDPGGQTVLRRWYDNGAQFVAKLSPARLIVESITGQGPESIAAAAPHQTWLPFRAAALWTAGLMMFFALARANAADLKSETVQTWQEYIKTASARNEKHLVQGNVFLSIDEVPGQALRLRSGEITVSPAGPHVPIKVPSGLIHDWIGAAFIPNVTLDDVLPVVRDYDHYKDFYHPNVIDSKAITAGESADQFSMLLINKAVVAKTALDSDYQSSYARLDGQRWYSTTEATRIQEIADYDTSSPHRLPENEGTGLLWRLHSFTRLEERDGGVYVELEAIALSRDIPVTLRWLVEPIVRQISRASLVTSLQQTQSAVLATTNSMSRSLNRSPDRRNRVTTTGASPVQSFR